MHQSEKEAAAYLSSLQSIFVAVELLLGQAERSARLSGNVASVLWDAVALGSFARRPLRLGSARPAPYQKEGTRGIYQQQPYRVSLVSVWIGVCRCFVLFISRLFSMAATPEHELAERNQNTGRVGEEPLSTFASGGVPACVCGVCACWTRRIKKKIALAGTHDTFSGSSPLEMTWLSPPTHRQFLGSNIQQTPSSSETCTSMDRRMLRMKTFWQLAPVESSGRWGWNAILLVHHLSWCSLFRCCCALASSER
jgi:hypothetical protein